MRSKIIDLLENSGKTNIEKLIHYMDESGFFEAPCSGGFHLPVEGGLAQHSWNVTQEMFKLNDMWEAGINDGSIIICGLLHDLGKMGDYGKANYVPNILKSGEVSKAKPWETNKDLLYVPHEIRSALIAERFISLTEEEEFAILYHNGMYSDLKYSYSGKETPLAMILHFADLWCSRVIEIGREEKE